MQVIKKSKENILNIIDDPTICKKKLLSGAWTKKECLFYCDEALERIFITLSELEETIEGEYDIEQVYEKIEQLSYKRDKLLELLTYCEEE